MMRNLSFIGLMFFYVSCSDNPITVTNTPPTAFFTVSDTVGTYETTFYFDASGSTDNEDADTLLQVRWDWENDGIWDTFCFTPKKTSKHKYEKVEGKRTVILEVRDSEGLTDTISKVIEVIPGAFETGTMTDIDGNEYKTIKIGNQWWMAENLKVKHFRDGSPVAVGQVNTEWRVMGSAYCIYNADSSLIEDYGLLYNFFAVDDSLQLAPEGWHIPSDQEWKELEIFLGTAPETADLTGRRGYGCHELRESGTFHWLYGNGNNESGFTALPGGFRGYNTIFSDLGTNAYFWSSTWDGSSAWCRNLESSWDEINRTKINKYFGLSVRCIKD